MPNPPLRRRRLLVERRVTYLPVEADAKHVCDSDQELAGVIVDYDFAAESGRLLLCDDRDDSIDDVLRAYLQTKRTKHDHHHLVSFRLRDLPTALRVGLETRNDKNADSFIGVFVRCVPIAIEDGQRILRYMNRIPTRIMLDNTRDKASIPTAARRRVPVTKKKKRKIKPREVKLLASGKALIRKTAAGRKGSNIQRPWNGFR